VRQYPGEWPRVLRFLLSTNDSFQRVELRGCFTYDIPPRFPVPPSWVNTYKRKLQNPFITLESIKLIVLLEQQVPRAYDWLGMYSDLVHFSQMTHIDSVQSKGRSWIESLDTGGWTNVLIVQLLEWRPMQTSSDGDQVIMESLRLGSLLYLASVWRKYGVSPLRIAVFVQKLVALRSTLSTEWKGLWLLEAWVLTMGAIESHGSERRFFVQELKALASSQSVPATDILREAKSVLWIESAFDKAEFCLRAELDISDKPMQQSID
jgi:hypothetical protein